MTNLNFKLCVLPVLIWFIANPLSSYAQYSSYNYIKRQIIVKYDKGPDGLFHKVENKLVDSVDSVELFYAFDKKHNDLYVMTFSGNYKITLNDESAKNIKQDKNIPKVKDKELPTIVSNVNDVLAKRFQLINKKHEHTIKLKREKEIADSIAEVKRLEELKIEQQRISEEKENRRKEYKDNHIWSIIPIKGIKVNCEIDGCNDTQYLDSVFCIKIIGDTLFYLTEYNLQFNQTQTVIHAAFISDELKNNKDFIYHIDVFKDSLMTYGNFNSINDVKILNQKFYDISINNLKQIAPFGFIINYSWNLENNFLNCFKLSYANLNKQTVKYLDIYWAILNDVGDVRCRGHFSGTGPVKFGNVGDWIWDKDLYYYIESRDATKLKITKLIITYMDGHKKILTGKLIKIA